jgi:cell division septation protein DedD
MPQPQAATLAQSESRVGAPGAVEEASQPLQPPEPDEGEYLPLECQTSAESDPFDLDELFDEGTLRELPTNVIYDTRVDASSGDSFSNVLIDPVPDSPENLESCEDGIETNPPESPAQHRNHSHYDLPILVQAPKSDRLLRLNIPLAAALLLVCSIGGYFLVYRPAIHASQSSQTDTRVQPAEFKPSSTAAPASLRQPEQRESQTPALSENTKDNRPAGADSATGRGRYSLQAAAFPNEPWASEFSERLKRAGVPAYVVPADIAGRGRWFRVRVGRFETARDADRFASEAQQRANAAGLSLRLIVSSYDKP